VMQMACTHTAAMAVLSRLGGGHGPGRSVAAMASAAARLTQPRSKPYGPYGTGARSSCGHRRRCCRPIPDELLKPAVW
jgi:hypothetical protein